MKTQKQQNPKLLIYKKKKLKPFLIIEIATDDIVKYMNDLYNQLDSTLDNKYLYIKPQVLILKEDIEKIVIN